MELKKIVNESTQPIVLPMTINGERVIHEIEAGQTMAFPVEVAQRFLEKRPEFIKDASLRELTTTEAAFAAQQVQNEIMWVANMTGNPSLSDAPEKITIREFSKADRVYKTHEVENPLKEARSWMGHMKGDMEEYKGPSGFTLARQTPGWNIELKPFTRQPFPKKVARWVIQRSMRNEEHARGAVIESRPPQPFEPSLEWSLNDLRYYLQMLDPHAKLECQTEESIRNNFSKTKKSDLEIERIILDLREKLYKRIWLRIVKPDVNLPTREDFEAFCEVREAEREQASIRAKAQNAARREA